jgi:hypothetical protein
MRRRDREVKVSTRVNVTLSDDLYQRAEHLARLSGRPIDVVLVDAISASLQPLGTGGGPSRSISELSDAEVLALTKLEMDRAQDRRLSELLDHQQAGILAEAEGPELGALMQVYSDGLLRKAQALEEAVRRGLREPLSS